jgi:hypothetical protein
MKSLIYYIIGGLLLFNSSCSKDTQPPPLPVTNIMIYNGSTAFMSKASKIFLDTTWLSSRGYNDMSGSGNGVLNISSYSWVAPGPHRIGFSDTSGKTEISEIYATLKEQNWYTFYLADSLGFYTILMSEENMRDRPETKARIRFVHLSPDSGPVDFLINQTPVPALITPFTEIDPMENPAFRIKRAGSLPEEPALVRKAFSIYPGRSYTFIFRGYNTAQEDNPNTTFNLSAIINF